MAKAAPKLFQFKTSTFIEDKNILRFEQNSVVQFKKGLMYTLNGVLYTVKDTIDLYPNLHDVVYIHHPYINNESCLESVYSYMTFPDGWHQYNQIYEISVHARFRKNKKSPKKNKK